MQLLSLNLYALTALLVFMTSCSCSSDSNSGTAITENTVATATSPETDVSDIGVDLMDELPVISIEDQLESVFVHLGNTHNLSYDVSDDSDSVNVNLYSSAAAINCTTDTISNWNLESTSSEKSASLSWTASEAGIFYLCIEVNDGTNIIMNKIDSVYTVIPTDLELWLKADEGVVESSGNISSWEDQSGNNRNYSSTSDSTMPQLLSNSINDNPSVYFNGTGAFLESSESINLTTAIIVFKASSSAQSASNLAELFGSYSDGAHIAYDARNPGAFSFDGNSNAQARYLLSNDSYSSLIKNGNSDELWEYDKLHVMFTEFESSKTLMESSIARLNQTALNGHLLGGEIAEIMIYDRTLSSDEISALKAYLNSRWSEDEYSSPSDPTNVSSIEFDQLAVLDWDDYAQDNIKFYVSYDVSSNPPVDCKGQNQIETDEASITLQNLTASTEYSVMVCAVNTAKLPYLLSNSVSYSFTTTAESNLLPPQDNLHVWYKSDTGVDSNSNKVSEWSDFYSGLSLTQADETYKPEVVSSTFDEVTFDGLGDNLSSTDSVSMKNIFIVFKVDSSTQDANQLAGIFGNYLEGAHIGVDPRSQNTRGFSFDGGSSNMASYSIDLENYSASSEDSNEYQWSYDTTTVVHVNYDTLHSISGFSIGDLGDGPGGHYFGGSIFEILVYDADLSSDEISEIKSYFNYKWGLSL